MSQVKWSGYDFWIYNPESTTWNDVAGIYIFAGTNNRNQWVALYIGQAKSFKDRLANHENWLAAARLGATHVHGLVVPLAANRDMIEAELIDLYQPVLNVQLK